MKLPAVKNAPSPSHNSSTHASAVSFEARHAWKIWQKIEELSTYLWDNYYREFLELAEVQPPPPPQSYVKDDLPF